MDPNTASKSPESPLDSKQLPESLVKFSSSFPSIFFFGDQTNRTTPSAKRIRRKERDLTTEFISSLCGLIEAMDSSVDIIQHLSGLDFPLSNQRADTEALTRRINTTLTKALSDLREASGEQFTAMLIQIIDFKDVVVESERIAVRERIGHLKESQRRLKGEPSPSPQTETIMRKIASFKSQIVLKLSLGQTSKDRHQQLAELKDQMSREFTELSELNKTHEQAGMAHRKIGDCREHWEDMTKDIWGAHVEIIAKIIPTDTMNYRDKMRITMIFKALHNVLTIVLAQMDELLKEVTGRFGLGSAINENIQTFSQEVTDASEALLILSHSAPDTVKETHKETVQNEIHKLTICFSEQLSRIDKVFSRWMDHLKGSELERGSKGIFVMNIKALSQKNADFDRDSHLCCQQIRSILEGSEKTKAKHGRSSRNFPSDIKAISLEAPGVLDKLEEHFTAISDFCCDFAFDLGHHIRYESRGIQNSLQNPFVVNEAIAREARLAIETETLRFRRLAGLRSV